MQHIKRSTTLFIIVASLAILTSCGNEYPLKWRTLPLADSSWVNIELDFVVFATGQRRTVTLIPDRTESFSLPDGFDYLGHSRPAHLQVYSYPSFSELKPDRPTEVFVYSVEAEEVTDDLVRLEENEAVEGYFAEFFEDGKVTVVVSKTTTLRKESPRARIPLESIVELWNDSQYVFAHRDDVRNLANGVNFGYIVRSHTDGSYHWLDSGVLD